jgi:hypothetical protein
MSGKYQVRSREDFDGSLAEWMDLMALGGLEPVAPAQFTVAGTPTLWLFRAAAPRLSAEELVMLEIVFDAYSAQLYLSEETARARLGALRSRVRGLVSACNAGDAENRRL